MNIVVCIKQVPDVPTIRIDRQRMTIIREGVESISNPLDCVALEAALDLRAREGGRIIALCMGPPQSEEALREAIAAGADEGILLTDIAFAGADTLATSRVIAEAVSQLDPFPDLVLCGEQTIDSDTGHVGPQIAEELELPQVCGVREIHRENDYLVVKRSSDGFLETVRVTTPALLTVTRELAVPRHLPLGDLEKAFSGGNITSRNIGELGLKPEEAGIQGSATRVRKLFKPEPKGEGKIIEGSPRELLAHFVKKLESLSILDEEEVND